MWAGEEWAYLFELLHVDVELRAQFCFRMGEGADLIGEGTTARGFSVSTFALNFVLGL